MAGAVAMGHTKPTSQQSLAAHVLRPAQHKGLKVVFKDTSTVEAMPVPVPHARGEGFAMRALVKLRQAQRGVSRTEAYAQKASAYNGTELKPYQGRPGSLDFLALPSLIGDKRVYRVDQTTQKGKA